MAVSSTGSSSAHTWRRPTSRRTRPTRSCGSSPATGCAGPPAARAQHRLDPGHQLAGGVGLGHVVVGAELEAEHPVDLVVAGRHQDHRRPVARGHASRGTGPRRPGRRAARCPAGRRSAGCGAAAASALATSLARSTAKPSRSRYIRARSARAGSSSTTSTRRTGSMSSPSWSGRGVAQASYRMLTHADRGADLGVAGCAGMSKRRASHGSRPDRRAGHGGGRRRSTSRWPAGTSTSGGWPGRSSWSSRRSRGSWRCGCG